MPLYIMNWRVNNNNNRTLKVKWKRVVLAKNINPISLSKICIDKSKHMRYTIKFFNLLPFLISNDQHFYFKWCLEDITRGGRTNGEKYLRLSNKSYLSMLGKFVRTKYVRIGSNYNNLLTRSSITNLTTRKDQNWKLTN